MSKVYEDGTIRDATTQEENDIKQGGGYRR